MNEYITVNKEGPERVGDAVRLASGETKKLSFMEMAEIIPTIGLDTSDATATEADIAIGETAYVNGVKVTGTKQEVAVKNSKTIYLDWSEDYEMTEEVEYLENGVHKRVYTNNATEIEADNGVIICQDSRSYATGSSGHIYVTNGAIFFFNEDYGTLHLYTDGQ
jgi:hypothetical protein